MANWSDLPREVQQRALKYVVTAVRGDPGLTSLVNYVLVREDWREFFEKYTFQSIHLDNERVKLFGPTFFDEPNRIQSVRRIQLHIKLPDYGTTAPKVTSLNIRQQQDSIFMQVVMELFHELARWSKKDNPGLALELKVSCHGDAQAMQEFRNIKSQAPQTAALLAQMSLADQQAQACKIREIVQKLFFPIADYSPMHLRAHRQVIPHANTTYGHLPKVPVVAMFAILRSTTHMISPDLLTPLLQNSLTQVTTVLHEQWRGPSAKAREVWGESFANFVQHLPNSMRGITLFDEIHGEFHMKKCWFAPVHTLCSSLASATRNLRSISISYLIDSEEFFSTSAQNQLGIFPNLETLVLTNSRLRPNAKMQVLMGMLTSYAPKVVQCMPRLWTLEIWNAGSGFGGVFKYKPNRSSNGPAKITYKISWKGASMTSVFNAWGSVLAALQPPKALETAVIRVDSPDHYLDFISELETTTVISQASRLSASNEKPIRDLRVDYCK